MGTFYSKVRLALLKLMETVGTTASNMASNAKLRANEINLENRRREILTNFSLRAFELWQKGVPLPESLSEMLSELSEIEDRLSVLRAQKYAKVPSEAAPEAAASAAEATGIPVTCAVGDEADGEQPVPCDLQDTEDEPSEEDEVPDDEGEEPSGEESADGEEAPADDEAAEAEPDEEAHTPPEAEPEPDGEPEESDKTKS